MEVRMNGNKLIFRKKDNKLKEIENIISKIKEMMLNIKITSENKNIEIFPYKSFQELIYQIKKVKTICSSIEIEKEVLQELLDEKTPLKYFTEQLESLKTQEELFFKKKEMFKKFHKRLLEDKEKINLL